MMHLVVCETFSTLFDILCVILDFSILDRPILSNKFSMAVSESYLEQVLYYPKYLRALFRDIHCHNLAVSKIITDIILCFLL